VGEWTSPTGPGKLIPGLPPVEVDAADKTKWRFHARQGVKIPRRQRVHADAVV